jgi:hypothetical protein
MMPWRNGINSGTKCRGRLDFRNEYSAGSGGFATEELGGEFGTQDDEHEECGDGPGGASCGEDEDVSATTVEVRHCVQEGAGGSVRGEERDQRGGEASG